MILPTQLRHAAKIDLAEWRKPDSKTYLSYLNPKSNHPVARAWDALLGCVEGVDRSAQTEEFLSLVERFTESLPQGKADTYRSRVVDYCLQQDKAGESVDLPGLSLHVDEESPGALLNFISTHSEGPLSELHANRRQLKQYTRLFGRDSHMSIGFSTSLLGQHIVYDEATGTLTIHSIPKALKSQLMRHSKIREDQRKNR